jgi:hypothetical protein
MPARKNLKGSVLGNWTVLEYAGSGTSCASWLCRCSCGKEKVVLSGSLISGRSTSCGCVKKPFVKHGHNSKEGQSPTYVTWRSMLKRCNYPSQIGYHRYGGRGITVCKEWLVFENFLADMGVRPEGKSLDRIDVDGNYEKANCRWLSQRDQTNNMAKNHRLSYQGKNLTIAEWARELDLNVNTIRVRVMRGKSTDEALARPLFSRTKQVVNSAYIKGNLI